MGGLCADAKKAILLLIGVLIIVIGYFLPCPDGLSQGGKMTLVILAFLFVMWVGRVVPNWVSSIAGILMLPFFGAAKSFSVVYSSFANSTFFFLLAVFGIAAIVHKSSLPSKLIMFFVEKFGGNSKKLLFAFGATTWVLSAFMSDLASCAIAAGIAIALVREYDFPRSFSKCLMIVIPLASMTGGIIMPISSATNATIMQLLSDTVGISVSYLQWTIVGLPVGVAGLLLAWWLIVKILKPEPLSEECLAAIRAELADNDGLSVYDKKVLILVGIMLVLWISGTWLTVFNTTFVALIGMIAMFLPGVNLLTWNDYRNEVPWDLLLFVGALFSLTSCMVSCGTIDWIINITLGGSGSWNLILFYIMMSAVLVVLRGLLPGGPLLVAMVTPGVIAMGTAIGLNPMLLLITLSTWGQVNILVPIIDGQWLMTYNYGYFTTWDLLKIGIPWAVIIVLFLAIALPPLVNLSSFAAVG